MRKNNITDIRYWLAETIIRIFNIGADNNKIFKTKFYIYNIESFNGPKIITISKPNKKRMVDVDSGETNSHFTGVLYFGSDEVNPLED